MVGSTLGEKLRDAIKQELKQERYTPSPGQTKEHVDDRVSRAVLCALDPYLDDLNEQLQQMDRAVRVVADQRDEVRGRLVRIDYLIDLVLEGRYEHPIEEFAKECRDARA